ncbi:MAG: site-specific DNA-methyltransferase [Candidatus Marinimicrobia bacterium]|nr:site-specific DNA-methyltransferase [Candidatus Neomarinimicrobiota bacterium]
MRYPEDFINKLICIDSPEGMKNIPDNSVDLMPTDPPYGYSFMGRDWDKALVSVGTWEECLRVLKPGGFAFIMCAPRQDVLSRQIINLEEAGFITGFSSIYWTYASGFPKAQNISKAIDKKECRKQLAERLGRRPTREEFEEVWRDFREKYLKPNVGEGMREYSMPLSEKNYMEQALKDRKGITWLDGGRIPYKGKNDFVIAHHNKHLKEKDRSTGMFGATNGFGLLESNISQGRFPANLLVSNDVLNDGRIRISKWGNDTRKHLNPFTPNPINDSYKKMKDASRFKNDRGSFSRYFDLDRWWEEKIKQLPESVQKTFPFLIVPKASKNEKNKGCERLEERVRADINKMMGEAGNFKTGSGNIRTVKFKNHHPTVKPIKLMSYLITLGSRPDDIILDPFVGSGTTCISAKMLKRRYIGFDDNKGYIEIAQHRLGVVESILF